MSDQYGMVWMRWLGTHSLTSTPKFRFINSYTIILPN
jgi:hypothetical protein